MKENNTIDWKKLLGFSLCTILSTSALGSNSVPYTHPPETQTQWIHFGGYYKNLFFTSETTSPRERFFADTQRIRLESNLRINDSCSVYLTYDNEVILNDFSATSDFDVIRQKNQKKLNFLDLDQVLKDNTHVYWQHRIYRGYLKYTGSSFRAFIGKQAIDWSRMRLYHPFDIFTAVSPLDIEKDEKLGTDALNIELFPEYFSSLNFIYIPHKNSAGSGFGIKLNRKVHDYDLSFFASEYKKDEVIGFGFDGYLGQAGFRGELTSTHTDKKRNFARIALGMDHNFTPKLYAVAEYFYNGGAEKDTDRFLNSYNFSRKAMSMKKHILGLGAEYEFSGVIKFANYLFYDFEGKSTFYNPELRYSLTSNLDFSCGIQSFWGSKKSEFGSYNPLYYAQLKYYF